MCGARPWLRSSGSTGRTGPSCVRSRSFRVSIFCAEDLRSVLGTLSSLLYIIDNPCALRGLGLAARQRPDGMPRAEVGPEARALSLAGVILLALRATHY